MESEVIVIGAGVTGMAVGIGLQDRAIVLEKDNKPGGVVKSFNFDGGYWFDNVVHLLHVRNEKMRDWLKSLLGEMFIQCPPVGFVQTKEGKTHYPIQNNLYELPSEIREMCVKDIPRNMNSRSYSYREFLLNTFGRSLCDLFFFPYNEKCWKYPLDDMTSTNYTWNINKPNDSSKTYNIEGYYPRPHKSASLRGMGILSQVMAKKVPHLKLGCEVTSIDLGRHELWTSQGRYHYKSECVSTIPLPFLAQLCNNNLPTSLKSDINKLRWTKVASVGISIRGERPRNIGHWHYYADPELPFSKLIYMTEFDEHNAPSNGYGILAEIPMASNNHSYPEIKLIPALEKIGILNKKNSLVGLNVWEVNPAYVIFTKETPSIIDNCIEYFDKFGVKLLGRYGSWEYSSMAENIESGLNYAQNFRK